MNGAGAPCLADGAAADAATLIAAPATRPDAAHFAAPYCHNCGAALSTPCCSQCGQERARRIGHGQVGADFWDEWGLFGLDVVQSAARLLRKPGKVARDYVLGARKQHVNPFKLLLIGVAALVILLGQVNYLASRDAHVGEAMALAQSWANWSFSLGLIAFLASTWLCFRGRVGYNLIEHLVLACYSQFVLICISILSKLPTLAFNDPAFFAAHRAASAWLLDAAGVLVLTVACRQFFVLDLRRDWPRMLLAITVFLVLKWLLLRMYAWLLLHMVLRAAA